MYLRNYIAGLLLAVLIAPQLLWLGAPDPGSSLPPCCRRNGKHHCAMMMDYQARQEAASREKELKAQPPACPYRTQLFSAPATTHDIGIPARLLVFAGLAGHHSNIEQVRALARISSARSHQKRGPPQTVLS